MFPNFTIFFLIFLCFLNKSARSYLADITYLEKIIEPLSLKVRLFEPRAIQFAIAILPHLRNAMRNREVFLR